MKILVTGANGYLGQGIVRSILNNGHCVVATDFNTQFVDERAERIACNLFEVDNPYSFFGEPDVLLHLAWRDGFVHYSSAHIDDLPKHYSDRQKLKTRKNWSLFKKNCSRKSKSQATQRFF